MTAAKKLAREYELIYILKPAVGPSGGRKVSDRITDVLEKRGAKLTNVDQWGRRKLAYPIEGHTRGVFVYVRFVGFSDVVAELERNLRNLDDVMRYQTVRLEGLYDLAELSVDDAEVEFADVEDAADDDDDPTFEERLGMKRREPERSSDDDDSSSDDDDDAKAKSDDDDGSSDDDSGDDDSDGDDSDGDSDDDSDDDDSEEASSDDDSDDDDSDDDEKEG